MMSVLFIILLILAGMVLGVLIGSRLRKPVSYDGVMKIVEDKGGGIVYSLELADNPELLVFQEEVRFRVVPPNYEDLNDLLSQDKPGL
jgi:hypothetical protein